MRRLRTWSESGAGLSLSRAVPAVAAAMLGLLVASSGAMLAVKDALTGTGCPPPDDHRDIPAIECGTLYDPGLGGALSPGVFLSGRTLAASLGWEKAARGLEEGKAVLAVPFPEPGALALDRGPVSASTEVSRAVEKSAAVVEREAAKRNAREAAAALS